jgi:DNA sulfur modification protein DndD
MLIRRITIKNFLSFYSEQTFDLPLDNESNLVLVLANNNTGKTNFIRALRFFFYGDTPRDEQGMKVDPSQIVNDRAAGESGLGNQIEAFVESEFELQEKIYCFRRKVLTELTSGGGRIRASAILEKVDIEGVGRVIVDKQGAFQEQLHKMVPKSLFDAFYFQGEPLDGKLLEGMGGVRPALNSFLNLEKWQEAQDALIKVKGIFDNKIKKIAAIDTEFQSKHIILNGAKKSLNNNKQELERQKKNEQLILERIHQLDEKLKQVGDFAEYDELVENRRTAQAEVKNLESKIEGLSQRIQREAADSRGIPFLFGALQGARNALQKLVDDNVLPADISEGFVTRVLESENCICGCQHSEETRSKWSAYLQRALSADMNQSLMQAMDAVGQDNSTGYHKRGLTQVHAIMDMQAEQEHLKERLVNSKRDHHNLNRLVAEHPQSGKREEIGTILSKQRQAQSELHEAIREQGRLEGSIRNLDARVKTLTKDLEASRPRGIRSGELEKYEKGSDLAEKLALFISQFETQLKGTFVGALQSYVSEGYDKSATDGTIARINKVTLLPSITDANGNSVAALGGGQRSLVSLSYVIALSRLRREILELMEELNVYIGRVSDQSFVIDSPFANVDKNYVRSICQLLTGTAKQTVVLMANQQWEQAKAHLEPQASAVYALRLHTNLKNQSDLKPEHFDFQVGGSVLRLINDCGAFEKRHTEVIRVK